MMIKNKYLLQKLMISYMYCHLLAVEAFVQRIWQMFSQENLQFLFGGDWCVARHWEGSGGGIDQNSQGWLNIGSLKIDFLSIFFFVILGVFFIIFC